CLPMEKPGRLKWKKSQAQIWLAKGWNDLCAYYSLSISILFIFTYIPSSHFDIAIYDQTTTEIDYEIDQDIELDEEEEVILVLQANAYVIKEYIQVNL
ncbi:hypothetical protein EJD97_004853, partial [Solanum chilense]